MKQILYVVTFLVTAVISAQEAREFNVGLNFGLSTANAKDFSSSAIGFTTNYLFDDFFEYFKIGPSAGFIYFLSENEKNDISKTNADMFIPIGASLKFQEAQDKFYVAIDAGYAMAISGKEDNSSGVFITPSAGYLFNDAFKVNFFYSGVRSETKTYSYIGVGVQLDVLSSGGGYGSY